jgi:hypothetical protein
MASLNVGNKIEQYVELTLSLSFIRHILGLDSIGGTYLVFNLSLLVQSIEV